MAPQAGTENYHHSESAEAIRANRAEREWTPELQWARGLITTKELTALEAAGVDRLSDLTPEHRETLRAQHATEQGPNYSAATEALDEATAAYEQFQQAMRTLGEQVRGIDPWLWGRVEAYPGWDGMRDVGAGQDMPGWLQEIADRLGAGADQYATAGAYGYGRCGHCGESFEAGEAKAEVCGTTADPTSESVIVHAECARGLLTA